MTGYDLVKRPGITSHDLLRETGIETDPELAEMCDIEIKYEGYIEKARRQAERLKDMEDRKLGTDFNYDEVEHLSLEGRQKLKEYKPETLGQASRISGVDPADISVLAVTLKHRKDRQI